MGTPRDLQTSGHTVFVKKSSHCGFENERLDGSISQVSRTSLSTTVLSPWPKGARDAQDMIALASRSLRGNPTSPNPEISRHGFGGVVNNEEW